MRVNRKLIIRPLLALVGLLLIVGFLGLWQNAGPGKPSSETETAKLDKPIVPQPNSPPPTAQSPTRVSQPETTGTTLVRTTNAGVVTDYAESNNLSITKTETLADGSSLISLNQKPDNPAVVALAKAVPGTQTGPEVIYYALATPNDPIYPQWYSDKISLPAAWDITTGSSSVKVAVLDTGFSLSHEDLTAKWALNSADPVNGADDDGNGKIDDWRGWDFVSGDNNPTTSAVAHGTQTAGLVGAETNNSLGVAGVGWQTTVLPLKVLSDLGSGSSSGVISALVYARSLGAKVANLSLGSTGSDPLLEAEINNDINAGMTIVAAAGNCGDPDGFVFNNCDYVGQLIYPANYPQVIAVGATDSNDNRSGFSSFGPNLDVMAPGTGTLRSTTITGGNMTSAYSSSLSGTSYSAPIASGVVALMYAQFPSITPAQVAAGLTATADKVAGMNGANRTDQYGYGRVDANAALQIDKLGCPTTIFSNFNVGGAITGEHVIPNRKGGSDRLSIVQPNNTGTGCIEIYTWADRNYQAWSELAATNSPAQNPSQVKLLSANLNGDGNDELYKIDYCGASGMVEVHGWNSSYQGWSLHAATNRPCISSANAEVMSADPDGDGKDGLFLVEYQSNGSGRVEVHGWSSNFSQWVSHIATNYGAIDPRFAQVIAADTDGDSKDTFYLVNYSGTGGSQRLEIHGWTSSLQQWSSHVATCSAPILHVDGSGNPVSDVISADTDGNGIDEFYQVDYTGTASNRVEIHGWTSNLQQWVSHIATSHGDY